MDPTNPPPKTNRQGQRGDRLNPGFPPPRARRPFLVSLVKFLLALANRSTPPAALSVRFRLCNRGAVRFVRGAPAKALATPSGPPYPVCRKGCSGLCRLSPHIRPEAKASQPCKKASGVKGKHALSASAAARPS